MSDKLILLNTIEPELRPLPIDPAWIMDGNPIAQNAILSRSDDGTAATIIWECTAGKFKWEYDFDETILILEGSLVLHSATLATRRCGPGDIVFFKAGAVAYWDVESHVRKLAFCRTPQPAWIGLILRVWSTIKRTVFKAQSVGALINAS